jgi:hypothetical protein
MKITNQSTRPFSRGTVVVPPGATVEVSDAAAREWMKDAPTTFGRGQLVAAGVSVPRDPTAADLAARESEAKALAARESARADAAERRAKELEAALAAKTESKGDADKGGGNSDKKK